MERRLRILLAIPAYWPAHAFGGPVEVARGLVSRLVERGHDVEVLTTTLTDVGGRPGRRTRLELLDGARVTYLATPRARVASNPRFSRTFRRRGLNMPTGSKT